MTTRDSTIAKVQQLPESLLQEVSDFIDFAIHKHQTKLDANPAPKTLEEAWVQWFERVDQLDLAPTEVASDYQQQLLKKYRQQGLEL